MDSRRLIAARSRQAGAVLVRLAGAIEAALIVALIAAPPMMASGNPCGSSAPFQCFISGTVYNDLNGNGALDPGETSVGFPVTIFLDTNNNGVLDPGEPSFNINTSPNGPVYTFAGLPAGSYTVNYVTVPGWYNTGPRPISVTIKSSGTKTAYTSNNFFIRQITSVSNVTFSGNPQTAGALSTWTVGFTPSRTGGLAAGSTISVVFDSAFGVPSAPKVTLASGFSHCSATATTSGTTVTVTLAKSGGNCALGGGVAATMSVAGITNPSAGTYGPATFSVSTTKDVAPASPGSATTIAA